MGGCGVPVMNAFKDVHDVQYNANVDLEKIRSITTALARNKRMNDNDFVVLDWIGLYEKDKKPKGGPTFGDSDNEDETYQGVDPGVMGQLQMQGRNVEAKATEVFQGAREPSSLEEYFRLIDFPSERRSQYLGRAYKRFLRKLMEEADQDLPTQEMSVYLKEAADVVGLTDEDVEAIHNKKFSEAFEKVITSRMQEVTDYEGQALVAKAEEKISKLDILRARLRISKSLFQAMVTEAVELLMKPAVEKLYEGWKDSLEPEPDTQPTIACPRKRGYTSGPAHRFATYKLLDLVKIVRNFTDLPAFNLTYNKDVITAKSAADGEQHWKIYWYVVAYGEGMEIGNRLAEEVFGMTTAEREFVLQTECGTDIRRLVWDCCYRYENITAEKCKNLWEPFGLTAKWVDDYIWDYQVMTINETIFDKLKKMEDVNIVLAEHLLDGEWAKSLRNFADEIGANIKENMKYRHRERMFYGEVQYLVNNDMDLGAVEDIATAYGVEDSRSQKILTACLEFKQMTDEDPQYDDLEIGVTVSDRWGYEAKMTKVKKLVDEPRWFKVRSPLNMAYPNYPGGVKSAVMQ